MTIGPTLPPHLQKRAHDSDSDSDGASDKRRRVAGPTLPPSASASPPPKPARVLGPAPPPAPLDERPENPSTVTNDDDDSSDDDDFGPAPPPPGASTSAYDDDDVAPIRSAFDTDPHYAASEAPKKSQRDEWMTMPPTQDDLSARMDPSKMRARKFNSGKSAAPAGMSSAWTETPDQKLKRLQNEALGVTAPASHASAKSTKDEERRAHKMREKIDAARGKSLVEQHQQTTAKVEEDDPSKRVFDYEKDMAVVGNPNQKQRREMVSQSKGFGDRFSSGSFL